MDTGSSHFWLWFARLGDGNSVILREEFNQLAIGQRIGGTHRRFWRVVDRKEENRVVTITLTQLFQGCDSDDNSSPPEMFSVRYQSDGTRRMLVYHTHPDTSIWRGKKFEFAKQLYVTMGG